MCADTQNRNSKRRCPLVDGYTLAHEHVTLDLSGVKGDNDCFLNLKEATTRQFKRLYDFGVRNVLEVTNIGMGRDLGYIDEVARDSGINIVKSTGFYKDPFFPEWFDDRSVEEIAGLMEDEISDFASMIAEIGTSKNESTPRERKLFNAAVLAHKNTGAPISTHTTLATLGLEQARFFVDNDVDPSRVVIGHLDLSNDLPYIEKIIDMGFNVGFDTVGKSNYLPDETRIGFLLELEQKQKLGSVMLSMDITRKSNLRELGYTYMFESFVPACLDAGLSQESIDTMFTNPARLFDVRPPVEWWSVGGRMVVSRNKNA